MTTRSRLALALLPAFGLALGLFTMRAPASPTVSSARTELPGAAAPPLAAVAPVPSSRAHPVGAAPEAEFAEERPFDAVYDELVALFEAKASVGAGGMLDFKADAEALFTEITALDGAAEGYCRALDAIPPGEPAARERAAFNVCRVGLDLVLKRRALGGPGVGETGPLAAALLERIAHSTLHGQLVLKLLDRKPYLQGEHEARIEALAAAATGELDYVRPITTALLLTLWSNVGGDDASELVNVALGDGPDATAAQIALLANPRSRDLIVDHLIAHADARALTELAELAARRLEPEAACALLRRLSAAGVEARLGGAFADLASLGPDVLDRAYHDALRSGGEERLRVESTVALANFSRKHGASHGRLAFEEDPSPRVQTAALIAIGAHGDVSFEGYFEIALADPTLMGAQHVVNVAMALTNYVRRGDPKPEFVHGAVEGILALADLPDDVRSRVDGLRR